MFVYTYIHIYLCPTVPGIVKIVDVVSISDTISLVTWNPPIQSNGIVTGYEVIYSVYEDDNNNIGVSVTNSTNSFNITSLCKL